MFKIYGATETQDLCAKCEHFLEVRGVRQGDCIRRCRQLGKINFMVASCPLFHAKDYPERNAELALLLDYDESKNALMVSRQDGLFGRGRKVTVKTYVQKCNDAKSGKVRTMRRRSTARTNPATPPIN